jgi:large subunit ribosomal protein L18
MRIYTRICEKIRVIYQRLNMNLQKKKQFKKEMRKNRRAIKGDATRPRFAVFRGLNDIYAQIIDDAKGMTLAAVSSKEIKEKKNKTDLAQAAGVILAEKAKAKGVTKVVFDRASYKYHGRVKALADGAREGGLEF